MGGIMLDNLDRQVFREGQLIFGEGDAGDCAYIIEDGAVEIIQHDSSGEHRLGLLKKGELFGEVALIDQQPRTATARATEPTVLLQIDHRLVKTLLERSDPILRHLLVVILERFRNKPGQSSHPTDISHLSAEKTSTRDELRGAATKKLSLAQDINRALAQNEFELFYQPICSLTNDRIAGFEALIRWQHPIDGLIPPLDFLWLAEQTGQINELGLWTLEQASRDWPTLMRHTNHHKPFVSVNLSGRQLTGESLVNDIKTILKNQGMEAHSLKLELTETAMVEQPEVATIILDMLIELGCRLALDDYGTGYSGLDTLQRYPIGTLKIDRAFIGPMLTSAHSMQIVRSSITLAHSLGMNVIAEGIETKEMRDAVAELGCDYGQGWYFGRPKPLDHLAKQ